VFVSGWGKGKDHQDAVALHDYSDEDAERLAEHIRMGKAVPGFSNHTAGRALDMHSVEDGKSLGADFGDQERWKMSWLREWLEAKAATFMFQPYSEEMWHWDFFG
jgi:hypothetical protein